MRTGRIALPLVCVVVLASCDTEYRYTLTYDVMDFEQACIDRSVRSVLSRARRSEDGTSPPLGDHRTLLDMSRQIHGDGTEGLVVTITGKRSLDALQRIGGNLVAELDERCSAA